MFCYNCGNEAFGNYCSKCGTKLVGSPEKVHWSSEKNYKTLINYPEVRSLIAKNAEQSSKNLSAAEFLGFVDAAFKPVMGFSLKTLSEIIVPVLNDIGFSTGKSISKKVPLSVPEVIVKVLCSLARNGYPLNRTESANNGLILIAKIPSDLWTWGGDIVITIEDLNTDTMISIDTKIKGQLYDWGKSKSVINKIISDVKELDINI